MEKGWSEKWLSIKRCWSVTCRSWRTRLCARGERFAGTLCRGKVCFHMKLLNHGSENQLSGWKCTTIFNISKPPIHNGFFFLPVIKGHNLLIIIVNAEVRVVIHEKRTKVRFECQKHCPALFTSFLPLIICDYFFYLAIFYVWLFTVGVVLSYCQDW